MSPPPRPSNTLGPGSELDCGMCIDIDVALDGGGISWPALGGGGMVCEFGGGGMVVAEWAAGGHGCCCC